MWVKLWVRDSLSLLVWAVRVSARRRASRGIRILLYHSLADMAQQHDRGRVSVPPRLFALQLAWLKRRGFTFVSLADVLEMVRGAKPIPPKAVAVTFDDGFCSTLEQAYPLLCRHDIPAAVFLVPGALGAAARFPWLPRPEHFERPLTWEEAALLHGDRRIEVGSHTWSHPRLSGLSIEQQQREIAASKSALEARLGGCVRWFAYPYGNRGSFSDQTVVCLKSLGFAGACANIMGVNCAGDSPWTLKRTRIGWEDSLWRFRLKMAGVYDWLDQW
jgi:peptidoglycan/xylan/chitin deacetylase (PgdA/CDA1 family)